MKELLLNLAEIQHELKVPKGQKNAFGNYMYRSVEDIMQAAKPILHRVGCILTLSDKIKMVGDRVYVQATATIFDIETEKEISVSAYAREAQNKKGMDDAQLTGSCSSYARKYALNGLFLLDDTKEIDSMENISINAAKPKVFHPPQELKKMIDEISALGKKGVLSNIQKADMKNAIAKGKTTDDWVDYEMALSNTIDQHQPR